MVGIFRKKLLLYAVAQDFHPCVIGTIDCWMDGWMRNDEFAFLFASINIKYMSIIVCWEKSKDGYERKKKKKSGKKSITH